MMGGPEVMTPIGTGHWQTGTHLFCDKLTKPGKFEGQGPHIFFLMLAS